MENNKNIKAQSEPDMRQLVQLYLSTSETLARYAYEASAAQQQMNVLAQQVTMNSVRDVYAGLKRSVNT
jgi:hypothetical protein